MKETKTENLLAGSTKEVQAGGKSSPVMKDGEEPPDMLLALLNNALTSLIDCQQAKILGKARFVREKGQVVGTILVVYGVEPETANSLKVVVGS